MYLCCTMYFSPGMLPHVVVPFVSVCCERHRWHIRGSKTHMMHAVGGVCFSTHKLTCACNSPARWAQPLGQNLQDRLNASFGLGILSDPSGGSRLFAEETDVWSPLL